MGKTKYTPALAEEICRLISKNCYFLYEAAREVGISSDIVYRWRNEKSKSYRPEFAVMTKVAETEAGDRHMRKAFIAAYNRKDDVVEGISKDGKVYRKANNAAVQRDKLIKETEVYCCGKRNQQWAQVEKVSHSAEVKMPMEVNIIGSFPEKKEKKGNRLSRDRISKDN